MYVLSISSLSEVKMVLKGLRTFFLSNYLIRSVLSVPFYVFRLEVIVQSFDIVVFQKWNIPFFLFSFMFPETTCFLNKLPKHTAREFWILKQKNKENEGLRGFFECESFDGRLHWCGWVCALFSLSWTLSNFKTLFAESSAANSVSTKSWKDYPENSPFADSSKVRPSLLLNTAVVGQRSA